MIPSLPYLLAKSLLLKDISLLPAMQAEIPIPQLEARFEINDRLLGFIPTQYTTMFCQQMLQLELDLGEQLCNVQLEKDSLTYYLQRERLSVDALWVGDWLNGYRFGALYEKPRAVHEKLLTAMMVRNGYSIHEKKGEMFIIIDALGRGYATNLKDCSCQSHYDCEHRMFAKEYSRPGNRKVMQAIHTDTIPNYYPTYKEVS